MECWSGGVLECWSGGVLEWRSGGVAGYWALCEYCTSRLRVGDAETHSSARSVIFIAIVSESGDSSVRSDI
jgi:hypothetical protein